MRGWLGCEQHGPKSSRSPVPARPIDTACLLRANRRDRRSRRAARRAGPSAATSVTADSRAATPASVNGSPAPTSSISEAIARVASQAPAPPTTVPNADWLQGFDDDAAPNACGPLAQRHANPELPWLLADLDQDFDALAARDIRAAHRWPRPTRSHARRTVASASSSSSRRRHQWQAFGHSRERRHRVCERAMAEFRERRDGQGLFVVQVDRNASPSRTTDIQRWFVRLEILMKVSGSG